MDFFDRQDQARKSTKWLLVYFLLAVAGIIASVYLVCLLLFTGLSFKTRRLEYDARNTWWNPQVFYFAAGGALAVIACGSLWKSAALSGGGKAVAESLGGRLVEADTDDADERKLLNVVEEMALASGVPVPQVYLLECESGINAFAAGHSPNDAVIGVTCGCMKLLKRDELQGVIAHEFSHILNGDMRLNLRLVGVIFGIVCLTVIGRELLRMRFGSRDRNPLPLLGLALLAIGFIGVFFARLIQAAVSRQREFLADASAVQFTRNPAGLSGALQKIGGLAQGSRIESGHAEEASHMFFGNGLGESLFNGMSTHPPLDQRIRAVDPGWNGQYAHVTPEVAPDVVEELLGKRRQPGFPPIIAGATATAVGLAPQTVRMQHVLPNLGKPTPLHLRYAESLRDSLPESVSSAARGPLSAVAMIYAMLLSEDDKLRAQQLAGLEQRTSPTTRAAVATLYPEVSPLTRRARLPVVNLALPALRSLRADEFSEFSQTLNWLVESDQQVDLFEYVLQRIVSRSLAVQFGVSRPTVTQFYTLRPLLPDCAVVLSALSNTGSADEGEASKAFQRGAPYLRAGQETLRFWSRAECGLAEIDAALNRLAQAVPQIKRNVLEACVQTVGADGVIQEPEAELLRAVAESLDCPIPPFVTME